jgi:hypothetical protein
MSFQQISEQNSVKVNGNLECLCVCVCVVRNVERAEMT